MIGGELNLVSPNRLVEQPFRSRGLLSIAINACEIRGCESSNCMQCARQPNLTRAETNGEACRDGGVFPVPTEGICPIRRPAESDSRVADATRTLCGKGSLYTNTPAAKARSQFYPYLLATHNNRGPIKKAMTVAAIIEKRASTNEAVHGTLPERTYTQLRNMIVRGRIGPGARIVEEEVALRFGVSRTPVREAIARLVNEGYLTPVAGRRRTEVAVAPLSSESVEELWGMIGALEGHTIRGIARLPANRREHLAVDLEKLNLELRRASRARPRDHDRLFELQAEFHQRFMDELAGSAPSRCLLDPAAPGAALRVGLRYQTRRGVRAVH